MPKPNLYAILGVPLNASPQAIRLAYRRLAMQMHPDSGREPNPARFREVHDAYEVLSDAARRRSYDIEVGRVARSSAPIEQIKPGPVRVPDDFQSVAPSLGEVLDQIAQNFFGFHQKSGGPHRRLRLEIVLNPDEASAGGHLPIEVPCYQPCPRCNAGVWMWGLCPGCHGYGLVESSSSITLEIPPGMRNGSQYELPLDSAGIGNLTLDITLLVA